MSAADVERYDVVQVGYGPVGQANAALLGRLGHSVAVFERHSDLYALSRAVHCDDEIVRVLQGLGVAEEFVDGASPVDEIHWLGADEQVLRKWEWWGVGDAGWHPHYMLYQPRLEQLLDRAARAAGVAVHQGWEVTAIDQDDDGVELTARDERTGETRTVRARYLIGADGANSMTREHIGSGWRNLGFAEEWLVVDVKAHDPDADWPMYNTAQVGDPSRPTSMFRWMGRDYSRWEFKRMPGETAEELASPEASWRLLERWGPTPQDAELIRNVVYTFRSLVAETWRDRRILLVGDAAHTTPPFLGQGMCSGIRDAQNLAWKLDLVLRGASAPELLDAYQQEREPHVTDLIELAIELGEVVGMTDPEQARERDRMLMSEQAPPPVPSYLAGGVLHGTPSPAGGAGHFSAQAEVRFDGRRGLFDDVVGRGWVVMSRRALPERLLGDAERALLERLGATVAHVTPASMPGAACDVEHRYERWFRGLGADVVVVRPDYYVFAATSVQELPAALADLDRQLFGGAVPAGHVAAGDRAGKAG